MSKQFLGKEVHPRQATSTIFAACTSQVLPKVTFLEYISTGRRWPSFLQTETKNMTTTRHRAD
jgi:hypothetical protein